MEKKYTFNKSDFDQAMENGEFVVYYQPIFDPSNNAIVSAEALVRWKSKEEGLIPPNCFISEFEESGLICELDKYVMTTVYNDIMNYNYSNDVIIPVSVNMSRVDFNNKEFIDWLMEFIKQDDFPKNVFKLEITETSYASLEENGSSLIEELHNYGINILLDDFGSGYSSFAALNSYEFDMLKIDMAFVKQIEKSSKVKCIIKSIIDMCHQIGVRVIAEGVETKTQVDFLVQNECDFVQGYYFSKPLPKSSFEALLKEKTDSKEIYNINENNIEHLKFYYKEGIVYLSEESKKNSTIETFNISRVLVSNHPSGVIGGWNIQERTIGYISDIALDLFGYTKHELVEISKGSYLNLIVEEDRKNYIFSNKAGNQQYRILCKDNKIKTINEYRIPVDSGQWLISIREFGSSKEQEDQIRIDKIQENLETTREIVASAGLGIWIIELFNGQAPRMHAYAKMDALLGLEDKKITPEERYEAWFSNVDKDAIDSVNESVGRMMENEGVLDENTYYWHHPTLGKQLVRCGGTSISVPGKGHILRGYHSIVTDIMSSYKEREQNNE